MEDQDHFNVLRKIQQKPNSSQRELAKELGFSLGKLNYCIKGLQERGILKLKYFKKNPNKLSYLYHLTPKGISIKTKITMNLMKQRIREYNELKNELAKKNKIYLKYE